MKRVLQFLATSALALAAACGGSGAPSSSSGGASSPPTTASNDMSTTAPPAPTIVEETATTLAPGPTAATSLEEVRPAVVRIVGTGTFADPAGGVQANVPGSGSGFIIDPSGIAVTNNHVVTGAGLLEVFLAGEDKPRNARVLGVSECSDLAVIQIDGADFDFLDWYDGPVTAGMEIFAAGHPLGDAEYTVLDGIVSKAAADGETSWASVDSVIEHSADTLPGNSGGPIVRADGTVVAVNYAGNELGQSFAIGLDIARPVVETLTGGADVDSIGINGEAIIDEGFSGIWVSSVKSGSPADVAGVRPGDLLLTMESIVLATDGTMADYCDVLRSHTAEDALAIEVYRPALDAILEGRLNGRPLEVVTSFQAEFDEVVPGESDVADYDEYVAITDESALIEVSVPAAWSDVDRRGWLSSLATGTEEIIGPALSAAPDLAAFTSGWGTPGVFIGASPLLGSEPDVALDAFDFTGDCTYDGRYDYDDGVYTGRYDLYTDCGPEGSLFFQVFAEPSTRTWLAMVQVVAVSDADLAALDQIFNTFVVQELGG